MPTPNMSDKELDSLFRRGAGTYSSAPIPPASGGWEQMEKKLDIVAPTQPSRRMPGRMSALIVTAVLLGLWQGYIWLLAPVLIPIVQPNAAPTEYAGITEVSKIEATTAPTTPKKPFDSLQLITSTPPPAALRPLLAVASTNSRFPAARNNAIPPATVAAAPLGYAGSFPIRPTWSAPDTVLFVHTALNDRKRSAAVHRVGPKLSVVAPTRAGTASPLPGGVVMDSSTDSFMGIASVHQRARLAASGPDKTGSALNLLVNKANKEAPHHPVLAGSRQEISGLRQAPGENTSKVNPTESPASTLAAATGMEFLVPLSPARLSVFSSPLPVALLRPFASAQQPIDSVAVPQQHPLQPPYQFVVGLLGAPSWSAVRTPQTAQLGGDYGLTLEYRFTARLRVRAGLLSSHKRYHAASIDYQIPADWQWNPGNYELDANCRITEIPLDLRYDVLSRPTYAIFTSLGLNSLLMRDEYYSYDLLVNGSPFTKVAPRTINGSNHLLSVLNLSVGAERPLGGRWSLQAEPFWQVPLGEVGAGKVRLSSAGIFFSLKYGLFH